MTVCIVFHLHNASSSRELKITLNSPLVRHELYPVYLAVTLDRTLMK